MERTERMTEASAPVHETTGSYVDWAAILAGAVVATAIGTIFAGFGAALGLSALSVEPGEGSSTLALIISAVWMVVTIVAAYAAGGYIAGRMRRRVDKANADEVTARDGINGLVVWGLGIIVGFLLVSSAVSTTVSAAGNVAGAAASVAGDALGAAGSAVGGAVQAAGSAVGGADGMNPVAFVTDTLLRPAQADPTTANAGEVARQAGSILLNAVQTGEVSDADRAYLTSAVAATTGVPQPEAEARVDQAITAATAVRTQAAELAATAEQTAIDAAETARISAVLTGFLIAAAALVAAAAAYIAAVKGGRDRDEGKIYGGLAYRR